MTDFFIRVGSYIYIATVHNIRCTYIHVSTYILHNVHTEEYIVENALVSGIEEDTSEVGSELHIVCFVLLNENKWPLGVLYE